MTVAGIDVGSRTTKLVALRDGKPEEWKLVPTGADPRKAIHELLADRDFEYVVSTGYGRRLVTERLPGDTITEIKACAIGSYVLCPECRTVIDIGGQDTKVIVLDGKGGFSDFAMNDRCAAGTGRFLEVMASALGFDVEEFGGASCRAEGSLHLNSMCVVFAESEIISLIARGEEPHRIAKAVHQAAVDRIASLAHSTAIQMPVLLSGGVARNPCIVRLLEEKLGARLVVSDRAQFVPALGAAYSAHRSLAQ